MSTWTPSNVPRTFGGRKKRTSHPVLLSLEPRRLLTGAPAWQQADIGTTGATGSAVAVGTSLSVNGAGTGLANGNDAGHFSFVPLVGDGEIDAQLTADGLASGGQIALMMRSSLDSDSADVSVQWTATNAVKYEHRLATGGWASDDTPYSAQTDASYLRLVREGNQISAYDSTDGSSWISVGSDTVALGQTVDIGVFVASGNTGVTNWGSVANVSVGTVNQPFTTSWIGNTYGGGDTWVQGEINAMYVTPGGTVYTDSDWDEGGHEAGIYQNGQAVGALQDTHGWGRTGGDAVTSDGQYVYIAMEQAPVYGQTTGYPAAGTNWFCIRRYNLDGSLAPFSGGSGWDSDMIIASTTNPVTGLTVAGGYLVATVAGDNAVQVYSLASLSLVNSWTVANPGVTTTGSDGTLWIASQPAGQPAVILNFQVNGNQIPDQINGIIDPTAIATTPAGNLLVSDDGVSKQVTEFTAGSNPKIITTFGDFGGLMSGTPGAITPTKFDGLAGVGMDASGNLIVSTSAYGATIRSLDQNTATGAVTENWEVNGLEFVDIADTDPASDGTTVYTKDHEYTINPAAPAGQQWTLAATTSDAAAYPEDPRLLNDDVNGLGMSTVFIRDVDGVKLMYVADEYSATVTIYRFSGDIAVPAAMYARNAEPQIPNSPATGAWIWVDSNGNGSFDPGEFATVGPGDFTQWGLSVDANGTIWLASAANGVTSIPISGFNSAGAPVLNPSGGTSAAVPGNFTELTRAVYDPATDSMYLGGYSTSAPHTGSEWGELGTTIAKYTDWSTDPTLAWETLLPYAPNASPSIVAKAMTVAGGKVFAGISQTGQILEYDAATGALDDTLYPGPEVAGDTGWFDTTDAINAFAQSNGQIDVFAEEVTQSKVIEYELTQAAPTALASLVTTNGSGAPAISVTWNTTAGATSYEVSRSTNGRTFTVVGSTSATAYLDSDVSAGVVYTYRIRALGAYAESAPSAVVTGSIPSVPVTVPVTPPATGSGRTVPLSSLQIQSATSGWGKVTQAMPAPGPSVGDIAYTGAAGSPAPVAQYPSADVIVRLNGDYSTFSGAMVVDPGGTISGRVRFEVLADGVPIYLEGYESAGGDVAFSLNVTGVSLLDLRIINGGDGSGFDHADWAGPTLLVGQAALVPTPIQSDQSSASVLNSNSLNRSASRLYGRPQIAL